MTEPNIGILGAVTDFPVKRLFIGITGSIAAISAPHMIYFLRNLAKVDTRVAMTRQASRLVAPAAIAALSGNPVAIDGYGEAHDMLHLELTQWAQAMLIYPATANMIGKAANGICDDLVSTCVIAASCPKAFVPAMNEAMWKGSAVQRNIATLIADECGVMPPAEGYAAHDGSYGDGAAADVAEILVWAGDYFRRSLAASQRASAE